MGARGHKTSAPRHDTARRRRLAIRLGVAGLLGLLVVGAAAVPAGAASPPPPELEALARQLEAQAQAEIQDQIAKAQELQAQLQAAAQAEIDRVRAELEAAGVPVAALERLAAGECEPTGLELGMKSDLVQVDVAAGTARAEVAIGDLPPCAPLTLTMASYSKDTGQMFPLGDQTLFDSDTQTISDTATNVTYVWQVDLPQAEDGGGTCTAQVDIFRGESAPEKVQGLDLGRILENGQDEITLDDGTVIKLNLDTAIGQVVELLLLNGGNNFLTVVDAVQLDTPDVPVCTEVGGIVEEPPSIGDPGGTSVGGTQVGSGELPKTGWEAKELVMLGLGLLFAGWVAMCFRVLMPAGRPA